MTRAIARMAIQEAATLINCEKDGSLGANLTAGEKTGGRASR
jgi:hypothetical protein